MRMLKPVGPHLRAYSAIEDNSCYLVIDTLYSADTLRTDDSDMIATGKRPLRRVPQDGISQQCGSLPLRLIQLSSSLVPFALLTSLLPNADSDSWRIVG